jgi:group I intron endonuclease
MAYQTQTMSDELSKHCGIYLIVSPSGGRYVGSSVSLLKRFNRYKNIAVRNQLAIYNSLKKYGPENHTFKVLFYCLPQERYFWERVFGDLYRSLADFPKGLNLTLPGYDDVPEAKAESLRQRISENQRIRFSDPEERKRNGEKTKQGLSDPEVRRRMSESTKKKFQNKEFLQEYKRKRKAYYENPESRQKAAEAARKHQAANPAAKERSLQALKDYYAENPDKAGIYAKTVLKGNKELAEAHGEKLKAFYRENPEKRAQISQSLKKYFNGDRSKHHASRKIINTETGEIFNSIKDVAEKVGRPSNTVGNWLRGVSPNPIPYQFYNSENVPYGRINQNGRDA